MSPFSVNLIKLLFLPLLYNLLGTFKDSHFKCCKAFFLKTKFTSVRFIIVFFFMCVKWSAIYGTAPFLTPGAGMTGRGEWGEQKSLCAVNKTVAAWLTTALHPAGYALISICFQLFM